MAAIDSLKAQRDALTFRINTLRHHKQRAQDQIAAYNVAIDALQAQKADVVLAIRDLTDNWAPVP